MENTAMSTDLKLTEWLSNKKLWDEGFVKGSVNAFDPSEPIPISWVYMLDEFEDVYGPRPKN